MDDGSRGRLCNQAVPLQTWVLAAGADVRYRVPRLVGMSPWEAQRGLRRRGLKYRIRTTPHTGQRTQVLSQAPAAGSTIERAGTVRLRIGLR